MGRTTQAGPRRRLLLISLAVNLGLLAFFKYGNFFLENLSAVLNTVGAWVGSLHYNMMPPAISFFTFASLSLRAGRVLRTDSRVRSARDYTLFVTFFPKLLVRPDRAGREMSSAIQRTRARETRRMSRSA